MSDRPIPTKHAVSILVTSRHEEAAGVLLEELVQRHEGSLNELDGVWYLRYEAEGVNTTLRLSEAELRLTRRGTMEHWQVHREGEWTGGALDLGGGALVLRVHTQELRLGDARQTEGRLLLRYGLYTNRPDAPEHDDHTAESLGQFTLTMAWQPQAEVEPC